MTVERDASSWLDDDWSRFEELEVLELVDRLWDGKDPKPGMELKTYYAEFVAWVKKADAIEYAAVRDDLHRRKIIGINFVLFLDHLAKQTKH